jgi:protein involved in sex pheromone biosynthesis
MKKLNFLSLLAIILWVAACGPAQKENSEEAADPETLKDEVMAVHDEVMPKMQDIMRLKKKARSKIDSLATDSVTNADQIESLETLITNLEEADEAMMNWMRSYRRDFEGTDEEYVVYLQEEKESIAAVKEDMLAAIEEAETSLQ